MITYRDAMVNYYVHDVEGVAAFYCQHFGFRETFRTPESGTAVHIEVRLGEFLLGFASIEAARAMHQLPLNPGLPRGEVALWTDNVDEAFATLTAQGIRPIVPPHDFLITPPLRAAWVEDPEGNPIQLVCRRKETQ
ncbi:MAG: VOC family protein [Anaerolineales bacterium]|nr:VOC family protein [Anaerolineales bacterium]